MYTYLVLIFALCLTLFSPAPASAGLLNDTSAALLRKTTADDTWVMSYYVGYQNGYLKPRDIDYTLLTHIVVGGVGVNATGTLREHWHIADGNGRDVALDIGRRALRAGVKKLVWLGGPNEEDFFYGATSEMYRAVFVKNIITLVEDVGYDGVDIDWEPIRTKDQAGILALVHDLRVAKPNLLITVPVNWVPTTIATTKDLSLYPRLSAEVDKLFVMSYSMAGPWPGWESWHGGALMGDSYTVPGSIRTSAGAYLRAGVPKEKLGIGIGTYATCWEWPIRRVGQSIPSTFAPADVHTMSMRTFFDDYYAKKYEKWDTTAKVPYMSFAKARGDFGCGFVSYENERSVNEKAKYVRAQGLGGVLVWNIGTGYKPDASRSKRHPLLSAAYHGLLQ